MTNRHEIWRCPACRGRLEETATSLRCLECAGDYPLLHGIPDFRPLDMGFDFAGDTDLADRMVETTAGGSVEDMIRFIYGDRPYWTEERINYRTRGVLDGQKRVAGQLDDWLEPLRHGSGPVLDLGGGSGQLSTALAERGVASVSIELRLPFLLIARRWLEELGEEPVLAAGSALSLPLADGSVRAVASLDVIEHVPDPVRYLEEIDRVIQTGGHLALSTPNRFTIAPEPHVGVWGVGWLPRKFQKRYVQWRCGDPYAACCLLSTFETRKMLHTRTSLRARFIVPAIPADEMSRFAPLKKRIARLYNALTRFPLLRPVFLCIGPFFRVVAVKSGPASESASD